MVIIPGYENLTQIHQSDNSLVYRARRAENHQPVILKFLNQDYPSTEQIRRYKQEYQLTSQLESPGIIKAYSLEEWQRSLGMVFEDFGGISLKQWLKEREKLSLQDFLELAIAISESLGQIHAHNIIHKDINPGNIVLNPETQEVKIIDFGISTQLSRENPTLKNPNVLEGTLAYISPEQTGRMNRGLDYRSDFYSLGATFYEMLAGKLPFETDDPLELVHCHIAKMPPGLGNGEQGTGNGEQGTGNGEQGTGNGEEIPQIIADIVMKLMAKNAEDRYQSADGLRSDLEECRLQLEATGNITSFPLGQRDISERFSIPQKLYGREEEIASLLEAFERVTETGKVEFMMVAGYSGIGKSCLVQELYKPITARRGYFISGKFDQFQRNIPYSAIVSAFGGLIGQLLGESEAQLQVWREKLLKALGSNGQVIIDTIPEVELIIGKQAPVAVLGPTETQNRFNLVFANFLHVFCDLEHPLTLFLDDLQWADLATLQLMERMLLEGQTEYLLLLGAYRDNEVSAGHPLAMSLEKLRENNKAINQVTLKPLPLEQITCLIGDTLDRTPEKVRELAELVWEKTEGNPFFVNEFLLALYGEGLLEFNGQSRSWQCNDEAIKARNLTDNVVELMVEKLQKLPPSVREILSLAACWGAEFDLELLSWIEEKTPEDIFSSLQIALDRHFILPQGELDENLLVQSYKFGHDRIQQAAYALIPNAKKESIHYQIGKLLLQKLPPEARTESIFQLAGQLNYGTALITEEKERDELAELNLIACRKAKAASAYEAAREYASTGLSLLGENYWHRQYEIGLEFYQVSAELASLCGDFEAMERFVATAIARSESALALANIYRICIQANFAQNKLTEAISVALQLLKQLGVTFPQTPTREDAERLVTDIENLIGDREIKDLARLPIMVDEEKIAIVQTVASIIPAAYNAGSSLFSVLVSFAVKFSIEHGNTSASTFAYATYGIVACNLLQDINVGVKFGQLALETVSQLNAKAFEPQVLQIVAGFTLHRKSHIKKTLALLQQAYTSGIEVGNHEYAGHSGAVFCLNSFWCGQSLATLEREIRACYHGLMQLNQLTTANYCRFHWQTALNLLEVTERPSILSGEAIEEAKFLPLLISASDLYGLYIFYLHKLMLCYLFEEIELAQNYAFEVKGYLMGGTGTVGVAGFYLYDSLTAMAAFDPESDEKLEFLQRVEENQTQLQQHWAGYAPMNHQHKVDLVEAEKCRVLEQKLEAMEFYNKAIEGAKKNQFIQDEALANELAAKFYLNWGQEKIAGVYMTDARYCYSRWGATAKVRHLEDNYPQLCASPTATTSGSKILSVRTTSDSAGGAELDLATIIKSTNAISSEIVLEKLLATLMDILVENAGARRGILILPRGEGLFVEATFEAEDREVSRIQPLPLDKFAKLSLKIVRYVARTRSTVVLDDAARFGNFTDDAYIQQHRCKSVACTPLINQNKLQGIIYLENNLSTSVFTEERLALLRTLATQGAISLENARLYDASKRFVPDQFLSFLEKKSIVDVELGDRVARRMTVLFSDIREFTTISEKMTPEENFAFINEYLGYMEPQIQKYGGFVDKYIGDAIMALFPNSADDAVKGAIAMLEELKIYNLYRQEDNLLPLRIGIGLHTGRLMLGTVGGFGRMDGTVIGDAVNLSSRVEGLTKTYGVSLLITHQTLARLNNPLEYDLRFIEQVKAKGKAKAVGLFEVFSADWPELRKAKIATKEKFERAVMLYHWGSFLDAGRLFGECLEFCEGDLAARIYLDRCEIRGRQDSILKEQ